MNNTSFLELQFNTNVNAILYILTQGTGLMLVRALHGTKCPLLRVFFGLQVQCTLLCSEIIIWYCSISTEVLQYQYQGFSIVLEYETARLVHPGLLGLQCAVHTLDPLLLFLN